MKLIRQIVLTATWIELKTSNGASLVMPAQFNRLPALGEARPQRNSPPLKLASRTIGCAGGSDPCNGGCTSNPLFLWGWRRSREPERLQRPCNTCQDRSRHRARRHGAGTSVFIGSGGGRCFSQIVIPSKDRVPAASPSAARMVRRRLRLFGGGAGTPQLNRLIRPFRPRRRLHADSRDEAPYGLPNADSWKDGVVAEAKPPAARKSWLFRSSTPMLGCTART